MVEMVFSDEWSDEGGESTGDSDFICSCSEEARDACKGLPFFKRTESGRFCVLHFPGKDKLMAFEKAFLAKLEQKDFNFSEVWFPIPLELRKYRLSTQNFSHATFSESVDFGGSEFSEQCSQTRSSSPKLISATAFSKKSLGSSRQSSEVKRGS